MTNKFISFRAEQKLQDKIKSIGRFKNIKKRSDVLRYCIELFYHNKFCKRTNANFCSECGIELN
jgi:hypothetical protein